MLTDKVNFSKSLVNFITLIISHSIRNVWIDIRVSPLTRSRFSLVVESFGKNCYYSGINHVLVMLFSSLAGLFVNTLQD